MTRLHQIIAVEPGVKADAQAALAATQATIANPGLFAGHSRAYQPRDDEGERLPPESARMQRNAGEVLGELLGTLTRLYDVVATKDWADPDARADLAVDGQVLLADVPVTWLLFLDKQLTALLGVVTSLPVLDPGEQWARDDASDAWATAPRQTIRTHKVPRAHVLYPATPEHPAQVQAYTEDELAGTWTTVRFSGALPATRVNQVRDRIKTLQRAVKYAREQANQIEVTDQRVGRRVFDWLLAE